jgi:hypothetical protein
MYQEVAYIFGNYGSILFYVHGLLDAREIPNLEDQGFDYRVPHPIASSGLR